MPDSMPGLEAFDSHAPGAPGAPPPSNTYVEDSVREEGPFVKDQGFSHGSAHSSSGDSGALRQSQGSRGGIFRSDIWVGRYSPGERVGVDSTRPIHPPSF